MVAKLGKNGAGSTDGRQALQYPLQPPLGHAVPGQTQDTTARTASWRTSSV